VWRRDAAPRRRSRDDAVMDGPPIALYITRAPWAGWQSGYAEDCKSSYSGSIPLPASTRMTGRKDGAARLSAARPWQRVHGATRGRAGCVSVIPSSEIRPVSGTSSCVRIAPQTARAAITQ
jgi:hypothetical protein